MESDLTNQQHNILKGYNMMLYFAGTMIMYEPAEECIVDFWKAGILKTLPVSSQNPVFIKAASQLRESCTDISSSTGAMNEDYHRLFSSENNPLAPVYESLYRKPAPILIKSDLSEVSEFYNSYGWISKNRPAKKDDHLGIELLFLTKLIDKYIILDDKACQIEMRNEINRFIDQHILSWIPEWHRKVQEHSTTVSYKGISSLILACIEDIHSILSKRNDPTFQPVYFRN
jgi:TorA maturation chaperone TorD